MELLISKDTVARELQVAIGYDARDFNVFIREAQEFDFKPLVCEEFYNDLINNKTADWQKLVTGGSYEIDGREYHFSGIARVLAYFAYARFIMSSNVVSTSHGFTIKKTPNSDPLSLEERKNYYSLHRKNANTVFEDTKKYIEKSINLYHSWRCDNECNPKPKKHFKTRVIQ